MSSLRWTHQTTAKIAGQLDRLGIRVGARTVARLLDKLHFSLRVHCKKIAAGNRSTRDQQSATLPGCAVDSVVTAILSSVSMPRSGNCWAISRMPAGSGAHPHAANRGSVFVGVSHETSAFAVTSAAGGAGRDAGATPTPNTCRSWPTPAAAIPPRIGGWKDQLQQRLCDRLGLTVTVAHYPTGASKYNPIDAACSVKSARTGPPSLSPATARSSV